MQLIKEHLPFLQAVAKLPKRQSRQLLLYATKEQIHVIAEIAQNIMANILQLSDKNITSLKGHRAVIRKLAEDRDTHPHKSFQSYLANKVEGVSLMLRTVLPRIEKAL